MNQVRRRITTVEKYTAIFPQGPMVEVQTSVHFGAITLACRLPIVDFINKIVQMKPDFAACVTEAGPEPGIGNGNATGIC
jgi:hypothetical protein